MRIDLRNILQESKTVRIVLEENWWEVQEPDEQVLGLDRPLEATFRITPAGDKFVMDGKLTGGLIVRCDRCLSTFSRTLETTFQVYLALPGHPDGEEDLELLEEDMDVEFLVGEEIDLGAVIREQIFLGVPIRMLCHENCKGLCSRCGANLNDGPCRCSEESIHPAFSKLKNLKIT